MNVKSVSKIPLTRSSLHLKNYKMYELSIWNSGFSKDLDVIRKDFFDIHTVKQGS